MKEIKIHLVLSGSFFPLHDGHLNLIEASRNYVLNLPHCPNIDVSVVNVYFLPTHPTSLAKKHNLNDPNFWNHHRNHQMKEFIDKRKVYTDVETTILRNEDKLLPMAKIISNLQSDVESMSSDRVIHKLIQVSGVDSRVQSIIKSCQKENFHIIAKNIYKEGFTAFIDLNLVLVIDGRGVPDENREIVENFKHVARITDCHTLQSSDFLPRSSTIQRFIQQHVYYKNEKFENMLKKFSPSWLLDTGINLGKGRGGIVRLMMLGGHGFVAVKIIRLSKVLYPKARFLEESRIWRHLAKTSTLVIPRLFAVQVIKNKDSDEFGIIVTEVGVALDKIFSCLKVNPEYSSNNRRKTAVDERHFKSFFEHFKSVSSYTGTCDLPFQPNAFAWHETATTADLESVKFQVYKSLKVLILPGLLQADVIHKDLKVDNILYLPSSKRVVICDFGVSALQSVKMESGPRGAIKYYPIVAIDDAKVYEPWCDAYFASLSLFEIFAGKRIFPDLNTSEVKDLRRKGVNPAIDEDIREKYCDGIFWIEKQWNYEQEKR